MTRLRLLLGTVILCLGMFAGNAVRAGAEELVFEAPAMFSKGVGLFPQSAGGGGLAVVAFQEISDQTETGGRINIGVRTSRDGLTWEDRGNVATDVPFEGRAVPPIYSLAVGSSGEILVVVLSLNPNAGARAAVSARVYQSDDDGLSFHAVGEPLTSDLTLVAPRLFQRADGGWFLFFEYVYEGSDSRFVFSRSEDAQTWEPLRELPIDNRIGNQVDLAHLPAGGRDVIVFAGENFSALNAGFDENANPVNPLPATFHLMSIVSDDGGRTWTGVDPGTGDTFAPVPAREVQPVTTASAEGRAAVEELIDAVVPYWYLRVSAEGIPEAGVPAYGDLVSRRPAVAVSGDELFLAWEAGIRRETDDTRQVVFSGMNTDGNATTVPEILSASGLTRNRVSVSYNQPSIHPLSGQPAVIAYSDPSRRGDVVAFTRDSAGWTERNLSTEGTAMFPTAVTVGGRLHVFWQQRADGAPTAGSRIVYLEPDQRADPPTVSGVNFVIGRRSKSSTSEISWVPAPDAAGIAGYSYVWSRDPDAEVPTEPTVRADRLQATFDATQDGAWYFRIRAVDRLGNWSEPTTTAFYRDTTPPGRVRFVTPQLDEDGYLTSNTFTLRWEPPDDDVIGGYSYELVYVAEEDAEIARDALPVPVPPPTLRLTEGVVRGVNHDNGLWALSVAAIDSVGNIGEPAVLYVRMNKYIPVTEIWAVAAVADPLGRYNLDIVGRGFRANGDIYQVVLDRDGQQPYDYVFDSNSPGFRVLDDRNMRGPLLDDIATGTYRLGLVHPERGITFARRLLKLQRNGTVKFGDFTLVAPPAVTVALPRYGFLSSVSALAWGVIALLGAVVAFSATRIVTVTRDGRFIRLEARALLASEPLPLTERKERIAAMRKRGIGLRAKFAFFVVLLIMAVVAMLAIGLGNATLNTQRRTLLEGVQDNVNVLMESIVAGASVLLPDPAINIVRLTELPGRVSAMEGALYATITGEGSAGPDELPPPGFNYVWATNDPTIREAGETDPARLQEIAQSRVARSIERKPIFGPGENLYIAGSTQVDDPISKTLDLRASEIDAAAREALGDLPLAIEAKFQSVQDQVIKLATSQFDSPEARSEAQRQVVREQLGLAALNDQVAAILDEIVGPVKSYPVFDPETFSEAQRDFIFYQPITYRNSDEITGPESLTTARYFRGAVRIAVSTDRIVGQLADARQGIVRITVLIALAAIGAGVAGALLLATIVVIPINRLVRGVEMIRDTADKRKLKGHEIVLRSRDELSQLADTVNAMTVGLVAAAEADEELKVSSDMQKMFMPLESVTTDDGDTRRLTSAHEELDAMEFHGYYEGADALSGDYFSFERLDDRRYALIKCDVSGHGVQAAIIMVEVATIFLNHFRDWRSGRKPPRLNELLVTVNDLVYERGFRGKFAAMTVGILDVANGKLRVSHAGDRILQIYRAATREVEQIELNTIPAAGAFSLDMFPPGTGYEEVDITLASGDLLILATDGIDEAKRLLRDADYREIRATEEEFLALCASQGWKDVDGAKEQGIEWDKDSHDIKEDFTLPRMHRIIEHILRRSMYRLERAMNPDPDEVLEFDFSHLQPSAENVVLGLMSIEKVFRLRTDPTATEHDLVRVDRRIAEFLKAHFSRYNHYFGHELGDKQRPDNRSEYVWFSHLREEEQLDDLTILAIRRK